jgi:ribonuclease R
MRRLEPSPREVFGTYGTEGGMGRIRPADRRNRTEFAVTQDDAAGARPGDLVRAETRPGRHFGLPHAQVVERLGREGDPAAATLLAAAMNDVVMSFPPAALDAAAAAEPAPHRDRSDLRALPLVTIDGADARDFDDAVWAEADTAPDNPGGWHLVVAIADVAWYVRPGEPLDHCAHDRGNSVYFPDRAVPMLPEALSTDLCSLRPEEDRACMAVHLWIDNAGAKRRHEFVRATMRSVARLTYEQVQQAADGAPDAATSPLMDIVIAPLYGAYKSMRSARNERGTLELELPERRIVFDDEGQVANIGPLQVLDSHRLIEEFMIMANVAAAETLESRRAPCMFRIHDEPPRDKVEALRAMLDSVGVRLARGQVTRAGVFNRVIERVRGRPEAALVNEAVLRSQSRAVYSPDNIGHFGLALGSYAHFTSPIRRYADLLVHRALITTLGLGEGGLERGAGERFEAMAEHISATERRAAQAERDAVDRLTAGWLAPRVGARFAARVNGVGRAGVFVTLQETGAGGLLPLSLLGPERFRVDDRTQTILGQRGRVRLRLGDTLTVRLAEANPTTGSLVFEPAQPARAHAGRGRGRRRDR